MDSDYNDSELNPIWCNSTDGMKRIPFTRENKLLILILGENQAIDWFILIFDGPFLEIVCCKRNPYAIRIFHTLQVEPNSRTKLYLWDYYYIWILLVASRITGRETGSLHILREYMNWERFQHILRWLHFSSIEEKIQLFFFQNNFSKSHF